MGYIMEVEWRQTIRGVARISCGDLSTPISLRMKRRAVRTALAGVGRSSAVVAAEEDGGTAVNGGDVEGRRYLLIFIIL